MIDSDPRSRLSSEKHADTLVHRFGQRWMGMNGSTQIFSAHMRSDSDDAFGDQFRGARTDDVHPKYTVGSGPAEDFNKSVRFTHTLCPRGPAKRINRRFVVDAQAFEFLLGFPHRCHFRRCINYGAGRPRAARGRSAWPTPSLSSARRQLLGPLFELLEQPLGLWQTFLLGLLSTSASWRRTTSVDLRICCFAAGSSPLAWAGFRPPG